MAMQFLRTLFWTVLAVSIAIFATRNWHDVTVDLWGPLAADIKLPLLMGLMVLVGWLPTWLILRSKLWTARRKIILLERPATATTPLGTGPVEPVAVDTVRVEPVEVEPFAPDPIVR